MLNVTDTPVDLTDNTEKLGSNWVADIAVNAGSNSAKALRSLQGVRCPVNVGPLQVADAVIVLADVSATVEVWRVYRCSP